MARNPVLLVCMALACWAAGALPLVRVAPNRLMSGDPVFLTAMAPSFGTWGVAALLLGLLLAALAPERPRLHWLVAAMASGLAAVLFVLAGHHATGVAQAGSALVRTALGSGFWSLLTLASLIGLDAVAKLRLQALPRALVMGCGLMPLIAVIALGHGLDLSLLKEYANRSDMFADAVVRHMQIVGLAVMASVLVGLPLAWALTRFGQHSRLRGSVFAGMNVIQTIPSIALFGLLMAPLTRAGIGGVGLAPAVLALLLYSLLPIVRSTVAGLEQVPVDVKASALAMGMGDLQLFWWVELPLALPVILLGLRTSVVQTIGLATITALIGAGGLGTLVFDGLFSAANELVVLGVLPIVLLALLADAVFKALIVVCGGARI